MLRSAVETLFFGNQFTVRASSSFLTDALHLFRSHVVSAMTTNAKRMMWSANE